MAVCGELVKYLQTIGQEWHNLKICTQKHGTSDLCAVSNKGWIWESISVSVWVNVSEMC